MKKLLMILSLASVMTFTSVQVAAQCPMCKISAESNMRNGGEAGAGLNNGILYMLATPYVIIGLIGFVWYRNRRRSGEELELAEE